ncbi:MAG: phage baseplate assembly protein [Parvibaculum sedimenti]|uniref:phage baseplate assembly protein domain-containing protein n=1 Tax=Parvibaculum sedimenti TaxID=2608632 RepID=UPI003BB6B703
MRMKDAQSLIKAMTGPLARSVRLMLTRCVITLTDGEREILTAQVKGLDGELLGAVQYYQHWGFSSRPLGGSSGILGTLFGSRRQSVLLGSADARYRPKDLQPGESCLFDDRGQRIYLRRDRIEMISPFAVVVDTPSSRFTGDVQIDGGVHSNGQITSDTGVAVGDIELIGHHHDNIQNGPGISGGPVA